MNLEDQLLHSQRLADIRSRNMTDIPESCYLDHRAPSFDYHIFEFEENFDFWKQFLWFLDNWSICFYFIAIYLLAIVVGKQYMKSRPPFQLRGPLIIWNVTLALLSIVATVRLLPHIIYIINELGFLGTLCSSGPREHKQVGGIWLTIFLILKIVELGDTAFIILRKTPLMFLHYYHHVTVIIFTWMNCIYPSAMHRYFFYANILMHSFVYSYFALKALRVNISRKVNIMITALQLLEMLFGIFVATCTCIVRTKSPDCCVFPQAIKLAAIIYASYFALFLHFFIKSYVKNNGVLFDERGVIKKNV